MTQGATVVHKPACTWLNNDPKAKPNPRDGWACLNHIWCHAACDWPDKDRDVKTVYEAAKGKAPWWWTRKRYFRYWQETENKTS